MSEPLILATDLDGTFLGGREGDRHLLYNLFKQNSDWNLIYVTGRGVEAVLPLLSDPTLPLPDYILADIGATVMEGPTLQTVEPLQSEIAARWPGTKTVRDAMSKHTFLEEQEVPMERRCSYYYLSEELNDSLLYDDARKLGCDLIFSVGKFLDVLPEGVNKGSSLLRLLDELQWSQAQVLVAGDTMNDMALFETGLKGVVVGNSEEPLKKATHKLPHTYQADAAGAGGIIEAAQHFKLAEDKQITAAAVGSEAGASQLVMVYHRLPFEEHHRKGKTFQRPHSSPNGIIPTLLSFFDDGKQGAWVAWSRQDSRSPRHFDRHIPYETETYPNLRVARLPLTQDDVDLFYNRFSKEAFWPIVFSFPGKAKFIQSHWEHYLEINRLFAEATAEEAEAGAVIWIHDYNLWMVPGYLRSLRPDLKIAFFHHTAFPAPDIFSIMPWRRDIIGSLLQCDLIGFHIPRYVENFVQVARAQGPVEILERRECAPRFLGYGCALGQTNMTTQIEAGDRLVRLGAYPVGTDVELIRGILQKPEVQSTIRQLREELGDRKVILSVERLDYVKGPMEKLKAFEFLLENHPEFRGDVVFINIATPPAKGMKIYQSIRNQVDQAVGRINGRFATIDWTPIRYFFRSIPFEDVVAHYAVSDIAWITPLRDGLNLVAKEYAATKGFKDREGVILLSEFAGAAVELHGALLTNPYDATSMREELYHALTMTEAEIHHRMERMVDIVRQNDISYWGKSFLAEIETKS